MSTAIPEPGLGSLPLSRIAHKPFPELAQAIRSQKDRIIDEWRGRTLFSMPELSELTVEEFRNDVSRILVAMADALESNDAPDLRRLVREAPSHGFQRFMHDYHLADLFEEERVLRRVIVRRTEEALARQCTSDEGAALHGMIDVMLQQGVLAFVEKQKTELRTSSESRLKQLSFLSHDLRNHLFVIGANLESIGHAIKEVPHLQDTAEAVSASLELVRRTRDAMRQVLDHERLNADRSRPRVEQVALRTLIEPILAGAVPVDSSPQCSIEMLVPADAVANTNAALATLVLQNLIWNAMKHCRHSVIVKAKKESEGSARVWEVSVTDDGPGIPADQLERIFGAFERVEQAENQHERAGEGYGLGLAIASEAARLLDTKVEVRTKVGAGSTFSIRLPI